jgi:hypothetical protein
MQGAREGPTGLKERVRFLAPHAHRLRALHIQGATTVVPIHHFLHDLDFSFINLKDFEITWGKPTTQLARHFPVIFGNNVPNTLLSYQLNLSPHEKFTSLTRFALKAHNHRLEINMDQLLEILGGSPTLQHLELEGLYFDFEDEEFYYDDEDDSDQDSEKPFSNFPTFDSYHLSSAHLGLSSPESTYRRPQTL